jgi:hypothetical protein
MFLLTPAKAAVYVPNYSKDIKDYYTLNLASTLCENVQIDDCKYLFFKKQSHHYIKLTLFIIHDVKRINEEEYELFLQQYLQINEKSNTSLFLKLFQLDNISQPSVINLQTLEQERQIFSTNFNPFVTAIPAKLKIIDLNNYEQHEIIHKITQRFREAFIQKSELEFKNKRSIILNSRAIMDDAHRFIVKKGVEYSIEFVTSEKIWINLRYTNFSRTVKSVRDLSLKEPIEHGQHKLVNIITGDLISKKIQYVSELKEAEHIFDTFDSHEAFQERYETQRFSKEKFHFEQTNLQETIAIINDLHQISDNQLKIANLANINNIKYSYKIIPKRRKYIFANRELHHTPKEGLLQAGVLKMPDNFKVKLLVSTQKLKTELLSGIISNINARLQFLYKGFVPSLTETDVITFDYNQFKEESLTEQLGERKFNYVLHLIDPKENQPKYSIQRETIDLTNTQVIDALENSQFFNIINTFEQYTLANSILKLGLKNKAIPWKIDCIDPQDEAHIFIGIDLGHNHRDELSNLTLTAIDNHGCLIKTYTKKGLALNEVVSYPELVEAFKTILNRWKNQYQGITIHRDGKFQEDIEYYHRVMRELGITNYNLVEVTKSGTPLIGFHSISQGKSIYLDGFSGYYIYIDEISYLITNDQSLKTRTAPSPLKIRKVFGYKKITELTEEIYWLTKAYSINIFESSKLPITTLLANNLSYSKNLRHFTTE